MNSWTNIYKSCYPTVKSVCIRYVKEASIAEDITQDTFITAIEKANQFTKKGSIEGWIKRIAINKCLDYLKKEKKLQLANNELKHIHNEENDLPMKRSKKSLILSCDYSTNDLLQVIDKLPGHHKEVFNLYVIDKLSHKEIASLLDISVNTSKSHLLRARKQVQEELLKIAQNQEKKKKKRLGIFFILPLGLFTNQLFASTLNANINTSISEIPNFILQADKKGITPPKQSFALSAKLIALLFSFLIALTVGVIYLANKNSNTSESNLPEENPLSIELQKNKDNTDNMNIIDSSNSVKKLIPTKKDSAVTVIDYDKSLTTKTKKESQQDSSQIIKKVVIPKKVYLLKDS